MTDTRRKLNNIRDWLNSRYVEREDFSEALLLAGLVREHVLALGPPGTAKSEQASDFTGMIGAILFHQQLHPMIQPEDMFGPINMKAFEQSGKWERTIDGYLPTAGVAILEEIDKAGPAVFSPLLTVLNERKYRHGDTMIDIPLMFAVGNCNATLDDPTGALWDRWLIRVLVDYIADPTGFMRLLSDQLRAAPTPEKVNTQELVSAQIEVQQVVIPEHVLEGLAALRDQLRTMGIVPSDRRFRKSLGLVRASAWLHDATVADISDLSVLRHTLWLIPEQRTAVNDVVWELAAPELKHVMEINQEVQAILGEVAANNFASKAEQVRWAIEARRNLTALHKELKGMSGSGPLVAEKAAQVQTLIPEVIARIMHKSGMAGSLESAKASITVDLG